MDALEATNSLDNQALERYLRIALSATCGIACALLMAMWVRSYFAWDMAAWGVTRQQGFVLSSQSGAAVLQYSDWSGSAMTLRKWRVLSLPSPDHDIFPVGGIDETYAGFLLLDGNDGFMLVVPYWFLAPLAAVFATFPWLRWHFSLRAMFIALTLVAVGIGLIVWALTA